MQWNIDRISGSPRFPLKPIHYLLFKIKSNKCFSPPLNSTWITLKLNCVESFLSFFIPITFTPTPIAEASPRVILWYVVLLQYCQAFWPTSILSGSVTEAESWSPGLLPGIHICTTWSFEQRRVGGWPQGQETCCEFIFQYNQSHSPLCVFWLSRVETVVNMYLYVVMLDDNCRIWIYSLNVIEKTVA